MGWCVWRSRDVVSPVCAVGEEEREEGGREEQGVGGGERGGQGGDTVDSLS